MLTVAPIIKSKSKIIEPEMELENEVESRDQPNQLELEQLGRGRSKGKRHPRWRIVLMVVGLITLSLLLTSCSVPNADPPCSGANKSDPGCGDPTGKGLKDQDNGGEWYDKWAFDIIRRFASSAAINSVAAGISIFWKIFTSLGSTDFVSCTADSPQCLAVGVLNNVKIIAMVFFPLILSWKFFKSYIVGAFIDSVYESAFSFVPKVIISIVVITFLDVLITGAFGISNLLFTTIIGNPQGLANASSGILGESNCVNQSGGKPVSCTVSGIYTIQTVQDVGLVLLMMIVCFLVALSYVALGICFFFRTILIMIMLCLSPLAVVAATTDESKPWFGRWLAGLQSLLIAPIPVAVCLALVSAFLGSDGIPPAHEDPAGFLLRLIYVLSFLAIGSLMMARIAGQTGGALFGLAVAGASALGGYAVGKLSGGGAASAPPSTMTPALAGGGAGAGAGAGMFDSGGAGAGSSGGTGGYAAGGGGRNRASSVAMEGGGGGYYPQQDQMVSALRAMNDNNSAGMMYYNTANTASYGAGGGIGSRSRAGGAGGSGSGFSYGTQRNLQNMGQWAGRQVGIDAPEISLVPTPSRNNNNNNPTPANYPQSPATALTPKPGGEAQGEGGVKPDAPSPDGPDNDPTYLWPDAGKQNYGDAGPASTGSQAGGGSAGAGFGVGGSTTSDPGGVMPITTPYTNFYDRLNNAPAPATPLEQMDFERDMGVGDPKYQGQGTPRYWQALDKSYGEYAGIMGKYNPMAEDYANAQLLHNNSLRSGTGAGTTPFEGSDAHQDFLRMYAQRTGQPGTQESPQAVQSGASVLARPDNNKWKQPSSNPGDLAIQVAAAQRRRATGFNRSSTTNPFGSRKPNVPSIQDLTRDPGQAKVQARWATRTPGAPQG